MKRFGFNRRTFVLHCIVALLLLPALALSAETTWRSVLYPEDWTPGWRDAQGRFLHDFSYAGYHAGERPLPDLFGLPRIDVTEPPYNADPTGQASATKAIQQALDDAARAGGGIVYLPEGTYRLTFPTDHSNAALTISASNIVLLGAGPDKTFLFLDETYTRSKTLLLVEVPGGMNWYRGIAGSQQLIAEDILEPTTVIPLVDTPRFSVGDWVALTHDTTEAWVREHHMQGLWPPGVVQGQLFFRRVVAVDNVNNTITIDAPTRYFLKVRDNARVHRVKEPLEEIGIVGFSFGMRENPKDGWDKDDHSVQGTGAYEVHGSRGILLRGVVNSWVRDVATYLPEGNEQFHIHSQGLEVGHSRHVTVRRVSIANPQFLGGGGNGYPFVIGGQDSLFHEVRAINGRHPITITGGRTNGNVVLGGYLSSPNSLASDFHAFLSAANLIDNVTLDQERFEAGDRSHASSTSGLRHGHGTSQSVFWNINGLAYKPDRARGDVIVWSDQFGWGYVIGTRGPAYRIGLGTGIRTRPVDHIEGEGKGGTLEPQSLYIDQLECRLRREGKHDAWERVAPELSLGY